MKLTEASGAELVEELKRRTASARGGASGAALAVAVSFALSLVDEATWDIGRPARAAHGV
jgi:hypothetical protein